MRKRPLLFVFSLIVLFFIGLFLYNNHSINTFEQTIDSKLHNITHPKDNQVSMSSNPYDYIKSADSNKDYQYIVRQGEKSLNYMLEKFADSDVDGLEEYIMAIACSEILKENPDSKSWSSGREWYNNYIR